MKVLFVASEASPFIKTGGLADVVGTLPLELVQKDIEISVVIPKYLDITSHHKEQMEDLCYFDVDISWREKYCGIEKIEKDGVDFYFIDNEYYFKRPFLYGHGDEAERFCFFNKAVLEMLPRIDFKPDIIHCHDWQTALISVFLNSHYKDDDFYKDIKTIFTIHNMKYQGIFPPEIMGDILSLGWEYFSEDRLEMNGMVNFMKGALNYSDIITTVSERYALEIQTPYYGEGMDGLLRKRSNNLYGIVNGIDYEEYNPSSDCSLFHNYSSLYPKKRENKLQLQELLGLPQDENKPVLLLVSRLVEQKGLDLVLNVLEEIMNLDLQFIILGTGDCQYENAFRELAWHYPYNVSAQISFDEKLARKMYAGSDLFLMPSRFEPCGIGQLIALRYLTVPITRETGGLYDTVKPYNEYTGEGHGFTFQNYNAHEMLFTIEKAINSYYNKEVWMQIQENIKNLDFSWTQSAEKYLEIYRKLL
ncbi:glycogen synthase GlgA [Natronospora cellulosivora (SeqCode)]